MIIVTIHPHEIEKNRTSSVQLVVTNEDAGPCKSLSINLDFPAGITLITGKARIEKTLLQKGESFSHDIVISGRRTGAFHIGARSFSYRDHENNVKRPELAIPLTVVPPKPISKAAPPEPKEEQDILLWRVLSDEEKNRRLRKKIPKFLSKAEVDVLCFDLNVNPDEIGAFGLTPFTIKLISHCARRDKLDDLYEHACRLNPRLRQALLKLS